MMDEDLSFVECDGLDLTTSCLEHSLKYRDISTIYCVLVSIDIIC